jgi:hypothetical protein
MTRPILAALVAATTLGLAAPVAGQPAAASAVRATQHWTAQPRRADEQLLPPPAWRQGDPADSLYRQARDAMAKEEYGRAERLFRQIRERHPRSAYAPDAFYWEAYMLQRQGGRERLQRARRLLAEQKQRFPDAATQGDAAALAARIDGELARLGDERAVVSVEQAADARGCPSEDDDERTAALNALLQMDAERAMPILQRVLARRDACSATLRRRAVFLVAQKRTPETENILLGTARNDPDREVREQAVFWLSQVPSERATEILGDLLRTSRDEAIQEKAIFALSQQRHPRAAQILRSYAEGKGPTRLRERAIFSLGQRNTKENAEYLRALYGRLESQELKERVLFSLSQMRNQGNEQWMLDVAANDREPLELRKRALFWAGQMKGVPVAQLAALYDRASDQEMKEQALFVLAQRKDSAAVDKLIDVARRDPNRALRGKAIRWLAQSRDPRVADFLAEIIEK